ncbi:long-chain-fatty-acid--CoA ligase [Nocardioides luteus]|uniref:long-chain-fatty-acid--CoA ligase n=1 Tax=Nocardioides luteus TaxID=1844 RepID=UPI0018C9E604|nr:long-chain-fatty-acid--CoA ligase [Nocardioides luteus]MBG6096861.1 acyl-CoA synthetase (AMP-forming)/AMP-acid ligase II [Nocardioides luteus]
MYLTQGLHRALQAAPNKVATINGDRTRTFAEQGDRVARLAAGLKGLGVTEGDVVAILSLNSDRFVEYYSAVPWADAVLNPINIRWSPEEIVYALNDSSTSVLLVDDAFAPMASVIKARCASLEALVHCGDGPTPEGMASYEQLIADNEPIADVRRSGDQLAGIFYTGGTTGFPKGVMLSHRNLLTSALGAVASGYLLDRTSTYLHAAPMFHLADLAGNLGASMLGCTHVTIPFFEPKNVLETIQKHRVTDVLMVPTMIQMTVDHPEAKDYDLSSLGRLMYGGSVISEGVLRRTQALLPHLKLTQAYGMTELAPVATLLGPDDHVDGLLTSAGRAVPHTEVRICDPDGNPVPNGTVGEICVFGANVMLGYLNKPKETAAVLRDGWMHTGDGGYIDDNGYVFVVDRLKDMIVTGGENVYSAEVETALSKFPGVLMSAVIGVPSEQWGETVHAYVVRAPDADFTAEDLQQHCKQLIANYKVPRSIEFLEELPVNGAGKILKRDLRKTHAAGA